MKIFEIALSAILGATIGVAITYVTLDSRLEAVEKRVSVLTPVAVVDFLSIAANSPREGLTNSEVNRRMNELQERADTLIEQGFVILRSEKIYSAPEGLTIQDAGAN